MKALATVTNEQYIEGTEVLFYSFLQENPGFAGDLIVIHEDLSTSLQQRLLSLFPITFIEVSSTLKSRLSDLVENQPRYANRYQRFWSLEVFRLQGYDSVLFMDSDILCRKNMMGIFELNTGFAAAPDLGFYEGIGRNPITFEKVKQQSNGQELPIQTFNAGVLFLRPKRLSEDTFDTLLELTSPKALEQVTSGHTDQYVLNRHFSKQVHWLASSYNFLVKKKGQPEHDDLKHPREAHVWHYIRHPKPWKLKKLVKRNLTKHPEMLFWKEWHSVYRKVLRAKMKKGKAPQYIPHWILSYVFAR